MHPEPATILFESEVEFLPSEERSFGERFVRGMYQRLAEAGMHAYKNLDLQSSPASLTTRTGTDDGESLEQCEIGPTTILVLERGPTADLKSFVDCFKTVIRAAFEVGDSLKRPTTPIFTQSIKLQTVVKPKQCSPLALLASHASNVVNKIDPFKRPPMHFGMRFRFGPISELGDEDDSDGVPFDEADDFVQLRFETYSNDPDYIWIECQSHRLFPSPVSQNEIEKLGKNIEALHSFISENSIEFLDQFDHPIHTEEDPDNDDGIIEDGDA